MLELFSYQLTIPEIAALIISALLIGMAKTGMQGVGMISVPIMAVIFGGKESTGLVLPILIFADLFGVWHYNKHANWMHLGRLLPFTLIGVIIGTIYGNNVNDDVFRIAMVITIFASVGIMIWRELNSSQPISTSKWFAYAVGILGGFTSMVGNMAGPVMAIYLLSMQLPKNQFIGTAAWFFLIINLIKLPFHIFSWQTVTVDSFLLDVALIPSIAIGAAIGIYAVRKIPENAYRWYVIAITAVAGVAMLF
jgi:uncharacterized membrane protein YfcA